MAEYIDRDEAVREALDACIKVVGHGISHIDAVDIAEIMDSIPAADVVEVVRCKDCKHWNNGDCYRIELTRHNDYCSYGERKPKETVSLVDGHIDKSNKCVSCGTDIPEGTWTCPICDKRWE